MSKKPIFSINKSFRRLLNEIFKNEIIPVFLFAVPISQNEQA